MANTLTCPFPDNLDYLRSHGFNLHIEKLPGIAFFCDKANIPAVTAGALSVPNRTTNLKTPQSHMEFAPLEVVFHIDSAMTNYRALFDWIIGVNHPEDTQQFADYWNAQTTQVPEEKLFSNAFLQVLGSGGAVVQTVTFLDLFPISLSSVNFLNSTQDATYILGTAQFAYTLYKFA